MKSSIQAICIVALCASHTAYAAGYTSSAVPTSVELVQGGVLIAGAFGDASSCGYPNVVFISGSNNRFRELVAMAYTALTAQREMQFYSRECTAVGIHWGSSPVVNHIVEGDPMYLK